MTLIFVMIVIVLVALIVGRSVRRRRNPTPDGGSGLEFDSGVPRGPDAEQFYAPSFIVVPGKCFRLRRDANTGTAFPCDIPVEGTGQFRDHRGNPVAVESCGMHRSVLTDWEFKQLR